MLVGMPDSFLRKVAREELDLALPRLGDYGAGNIFVGKGEGVAEESKRMVGQRVWGLGAGWLTGD